MSRVVVHIERLVLNGYEPKDGKAFASAVQAELTRLLSSDGGVSGLAALAQGPPPRITIAAEHDAKPAALGRAVARSIVKENGR